MAYGARTLFSGATLLALAPVIALAQPSVTGANFDAGRWLSRGDPLELTLDRLPAPAEGRLHVFLGALDVTSQLRTEGSALRYAPGAVPLESGESVVRVYLVAPDDTWVELDRRPLRVLTRSGFEVAEVDPTLDVTLESRIADSRDAVPPDLRDRYLLGSFAAGLTSRHRGFGTSLGGGATVLGQSQRERALRFYEKGSEAPRADLSDYRLDLERDGLGFQLGHLWYGSHRHLVQGFASRGMTVRYQLHDQVDLSSAWLNGQSVVGWDNILGVRDARDNTLRAGTIGVNVLQGERARLRVETTYVNGTLSFADDFNAGQVRDAETSQGLGVTIDAGLLSERLRTRAGFARSRYDSAIDEQLEGGLDVVSVRTTRDSARYAELELDVLRGLTIGGGRQATVTLLGTVERIDPQYKTLGVFTTSDLQKESLGVQADLGGVWLRIASSRSRDNLDDIPTLLETRTRTLTADLSIPLPVLLAASGASAEWLPSLSYGLMRSLQRGVNAPSKDRSAFDLGSIPDQMNLLQTASLDWSRERWSAGYRLAWSLQDNRQPRRESADFRDVTQGVFVSLRPTDRLGLHAGADRTLQKLREEDLTRRLRTLSAGFDWRLLRDWSIAANWSDTRETDSHDALTRRANTLDGELAWHVSIPALRLGARPTRTYLRYARQADRFDDGLFLFRSRAKSSALYLGMSVSLF